MPKIVRLVYPSVRSSVTLIDLRVLCVTAHAKVPGWPPTSFPRGYGSMVSSLFQSQASSRNFSYSKVLTYTVSGRNTIGIYITRLVLIQPTDVEQNAVNNNWLLKLQPAVKLQSWQKSNFHQIE